MDIDLDKVLGTTTNSTAQSQQSDNQQGQGAQQNGQGDLGQMVQGNLPQQVSQAQQQTDDNQQQNQQSSGGQSVSVSPEGGPVVETVNPMEKQFEELNEVLDTNLTDEIERDLFEEAVGQGPVPEGHEVMKKTIEGEQEADKAASGESAPVAPGQPGTPPVIPQAQVQPPPQVSQGVPPVVPQVPPVIPQ